MRVTQKRRGGVAMAELVRERAHGEPLADLAAIEPPRISAADWSGAGRAVFTTVAAV
jgi:hypothetical protein